MIDRRTALTSEKLIINNPSELAYVLKKFASLDVVLLD